MGISTVYAKCMRFECPWTIGVKAIHSENCTLVTQLHVLHVSAARDRRGLICEKRYKSFFYLFILMNKSWVFKATDANGKIVAIKKSRVSKKVQRPILQHETRILRLLNEHPSIPILYGYGHLDHFEYISLELLGPSIDKKLQQGTGLEEKTVVRIVDQTARITTAFDVFCS